MAIQNRRGAYTDFDASRMVAGEFAVVQTGDPAAEDGKAIYIAFGAGNVKRLATPDDVADAQPEITYDSNTKTVTLTIGGT